MPRATQIRRAAITSPELMPPYKNRNEDLLNINRYESAIPRIACGIVAVGMTAITIGVFGVVPARTGSDSFEPGSLATANVTAPAPTRVVVQCSSSNSDRKPEGST